MIRQKRFSITRNSHNNSKISNTENICQNSMVDFQKQKVHQAKKHLLNENRAGLSQLISNNTNRDFVFLKPLCNESRPQTQPQLKNKENIFARISELIKIQDIPMPICHSNKKNQLRCAKQRPLSSFSQNNKNIVDQAQLNKFSVVLDLTKNEESLPPERSSTSRALMNYSKVYRNNSNDGFRVKKNMSIVNRYVHLSAHKVVFQEKQKRQRSFQRTAFLKKCKNDKKTEDRYKEQQDFELGGWDYFE